MLRRDGGNVSYSGEKRDYSMKRVYSGGRKQGGLRLCLLLCFIIVFQFVQPVCASAEEYRTVRVGYYQAGGFQEGDGSTRMRSGYGYAYLQKVASYTGWRYEYVPGTWDELYEKLKTGDIDLMAGVAWSEERQSEVLFPDLSRKPSTSTRTSTTARCRAASSPRTPASASA